MSLIRRHSHNAFKNRCHLKKLLELFKNYHAFFFFAFRFTIKHEVIELWREIKHLVFCLV